MQPETLCIVDGVEPETTNARTVYTVCVASPQDFKGLVGTAAHANFSRTSTVTVAYSLRPSSALKRSTYAKNHILSWGLK